MGSVITTIVILIIAFENIQSVCVDMYVFFGELSATTTPTVLIFWVAGLGVICGFFYHGLLHSLFSKKNEDDEDDE
jgi:hypothetical protein